MQKNSFRNCLLFINENVDKADRKRWPILQSVEMGEMWNEQLEWDKMINKTIKTLHNYYHWPSAGVIKCLSSIRRLFEFFSRSFHVCLCWSGVCSVFSMFWMWSVIKFVDNVIFHLYSHYDMGSGLSDHSEYLRIL